MPGQQPEGLLGIIAALVSDKGNDHCVVLALAHNLASKWVQPRVLPAPLLDALMGYPPWQTTQEEPHLFAGGRWKVKLGCIFVVLFCSLHLCCMFILLFLVCLSFGWAHEVFGLLVIWLGL